MKTQIVSIELDSIEQIDDELSYIKKKDYSGLKVQIELDIDEVYELIERIIYEDTQIELSDYDIILDGENCLDEGLSSLLEYVSNEDEREYLKKNLCKKYSPGVMNNLIDYVLQITCETETYDIKRSEYCVSFLINIDDFNDKYSNIAKYTRLLFG